MQRADESTRIMVKIIGQRHAKRDLRTLHIVWTHISPNRMLKTPIRNQIVYKARNICDIDVTSVKMCRPWSDATSQMPRLFWSTLLAYVWRSLFARRWPIILYWKRLSITWPPIQYVLILCQLLIRRSVKHKFHNSCINIFLSCSPLFIFFVQWFSLRVTSDI